MKPSRILTIILLFIVAVSLCAVFYLLAKNIHPVAPLPKRKFKNGSLPDIAITNFHQSSIKNGWTELEVKADKVRVFNRTNRMILENVSAVFFAKNGQRSTLVADSGTLDTKSNDMELSGDITIENGVYKIVAQTLQYRAKSDIILSKNPVILTGDSIRCSAKSFVLYTATGRLVMSGDVEADIAVHAPAQGRDL